MRPLRDLQEEASSKIPRGPLGYAGRGNLIGATGLVGVSLARAVIPLSEFDPGYSVESSSKEEREGKTVRTFVIHAYSKDVARFIAKRRSAPTNADFILQDIEVVSIEPIKEKSTATEWEIVTETESRQVADELGGM